MLFFIHVFIKYLWFKFIPFVKCHSVISEECIMMPLYNSYTCKNTILNFCLFKQTHKLADILRQNLMPMYGYVIYINYNIKI